MIEISQHKQNIIGSREAIAALENKDHARLLVLSDSHGRYGLMESIVRGFGGKCDALIFCGDGVCDIAQLLYAQKVGWRRARLIRSFPNRTAVRRGHSSSRTGRSMSRSSSPGPCTTSISRHSRCNNDHDVAHHTVSCCGGDLGLYLGPGVVPVVPNKMVFPEHAARL